MNMLQAKIGMKAASFVGAIIALPTLLLALLTSARGQGFWALLYAIFILILVYFIFYKQSRVAAVTILVFYILDKLLAIPLMLKNPPKFWIIWVLYIATFIQGIRGTFTYHRLTGERKKLFR